MDENLPAKAADNWDLQAVVSCCFSTAYGSAKDNSQPPQQQVTTTTTSSADPPAAAAAVAFTADENSSDPLAFLANMEIDDDYEEDDDPFSFPLLLENDNNNNGFDELQDSYMPFFPTPSSLPEGLTCNQFTGTASTMNSSFFPPVFGGQNNQHTQQANRVQQVLQQQQLQQQQQQPPPPQPPMMMGSVIPFQSQASRTRKRKTPMKKMVCQVKFEQLSVDTWAWRKYGQKPIKGSPYPRNYYRCSSTKGCGARKQVERSNTDPGIYIVSYTGDHTHPRPAHRNSLAGSTRNKFSRTHHQIPVTVTAAATTTPMLSTIASDSSSSPVSATCQPPSFAPQTKEPDIHKEDKRSFMKEEEEEDDNDDLFEDLLIPNLAAPGIDEDFFKGLKQFGTNTVSGSGGNDC